MLAIPDAVDTGMRRFAAAVSDGLEAIAARAERRAAPPIPDLRAHFAAAAALVTESVARIADPEVIAHLESRLALYRELVPRIERLAADVDA